MIKNLALSICLAVITISNALSADVEYEIQDIGTLQTRSSEAIAINDHGMILGWYNIDGSKHFFVCGPKEEYHEIPGIIDGIIIQWKTLTNDGVVYGTYEKNNNADTPILFKWDYNNGIVNLGELPGGIPKINNLGQVLIRGLKEIKNGKSIFVPAIWKDGNLTKLKQVEGDLGIESDSAVALDMNNKGEVVGYSHVCLNYKNELYKQPHATKWVNGEAFDIHMKNSKKSIASSADLINDNGEVYVKGEISYFIDKNDRIIDAPNDLTRINSNYIYNDRYVFSTKMVMVMRKEYVNKQIQDDINSIWLKIDKIVDVNEKGDIIALGKTIYGEKHAMLLTPVKPN